MKLHTANKYLSSLPDVAEKGLGARFDALLEATCAALGIDVVSSALLAVSGKEYSYVCRAIASSLDHAGYGAALINLDPDAPAEELVKLAHVNVSDDDAAQVVTVIRRSAAALGITPTRVEAKLLCGLALCSRNGSKNIILGFDAARIPRAFCDILPLARTVVLLPSDAGVSDSSAIVRKGVLEVISAPRGEDEYRVISSTCAKVNCRHSVIARTAIASLTLTYKGIEFSYREREYAMRGHSESLAIGAVAAILASCALGRRGFKINESDVAAILSDVSVDYGCKVESYNPCVIGLVCRNRAEARQTRNDAEKVCAHFGKSACFFSEFNGDAELESAFNLCASDDRALCVEGTPRFVRNVMNVIAEWISPSVK